MTSAKTADMYIIHMLEVKTRVSVEEICEACGLAPSTVRKKLARLEQEGLLIRTHGGAVSLDANRDETIEKKARSNVSRKKAIAAACARLIREGDLLLLGGGSTAAELCRFIRELRKAAVYTDSVSIADMLAKGTSGAIEVRINSGIVRGRSGCVVGPEADRLFTELKNRAGKCFLGCEGGTAADGVGVDNILVGEVEKAMFSAAKERYILCDSTKLGRKTIFRVAGIEEATALITDSGADPMILEQIRQKGVRVIVAG